MAPKPSEPPSVEVEPSVVPPASSPEKPSTNNAKAENASLKRTREGSQEPTPSPNPVPLATKKNRLETTSETEEPAVPGTVSAVLAKEASSSSETGKVGEVRRKVQEMGWEELKDEEVREAKEHADALGDAGAQSKEQEGGLKRKALQRNESSVLGQGEEEVPAKKSRETPSPPPEADKKTEASAAPAAEAEAPAPTAPAPAPEAKKPQATFGSFSKTASPFTANRTSSPFASAGVASGSGSGSKPLGSGSAFGTYSSSFSAFSKKTPTVPQPPPSAAEAKTATTEDGTAAAAAGPSTGTGASTFGDILKQSKADDGETADKVQMTEKDVYTGEEDEQTVYQCRAKLYVMQADGGWKERGVGALRLNVRAGDKGGPRLVMRAEGVLRLILNVSLYVGMACLEDGKHVRSTVFEDNEKRFITFRLGTQKAASELCQNIQDHIPLESSTKSPPPSAPSPSKIV